MESIENDLTQEKDWKIVVEISGKKLEMKLDTGSQVNVLPFKVYNRLSSSPLRKSRCRLVSYSGHKLNTIGKATLLVGTREKFTPGGISSCRSQITACFGFTDMSRLTVD